MKQNRGSSVRGGAITKGGSHLQKGKQTSNWKNLKKVFASSLGSSFGVVKRIKKKLKGGGPEGKEHIKKWG